MPNFIVCPATSEDVEAVAKINYAAFYSSDVGFQVIFPKGATEESVRYTAAQMKHDLEQNKNSNLMVVKDAVTGEIAAWATWHFLPSRAPEEIEKEMLMDQFPLPADANIAAGNRLIHDGMRKHHELIAKYYGIGAPHAYLEALGTSPNFQKQGAGSLLVAWGCAQADEKHLPAYLQATTMGRRLYERHGFMEIDQLKLEMSPWKDGDFYHICMLRPAKPTQTRQFGNIEYPNDPAIGLNDGTARCRCSEAKGGTCTTFLFFDITKSIVEERCGE